MATNPLNIVGSGGKKGGIAAIILAASVSLYSFTTGYEGVKYNAYLDPIKKPTICAGHTLGVHLGQTATKAQCLVFFQQDMSAAMQEDIKITPQLTENISALKSAGDFTFNSGAGNFKRSPMAIHFANKDWRAGCNSFVGYLDDGISKKPIHGAQCTYHPNKGVYTCVLPGLVKRRIGEKNICLGLLDPTPDLSNAAN